MTPKNILATGFLFLIFTLCSFLLKDKPNLNIVFIGDSITEGTGLDDPKTEAAPVQATAFLRQQGKFGKVTFANQGVSGFTTVDFLPATAKAFNNVKKAADDFYADKEATLVFSVMLGTNDSAIKGPNGSPVSPPAYRSHLKAIADRLLADYPNTKIVLHRPVWYSPNTQNNSKYLQEGLNRLQQYFPEIDALVKDYAATHPEHVFAGDKQAFAYFKKHHKTNFRLETGEQGIFFLHPNKQGAIALGQFWGKAIEKIIRL